MSKNKVLTELKEHGPFTFLATLVAIMLVVIVKFSFSQNIPEALFHIMHPAHIFVSALVSAAIFYKYKKNIIQALLVGMFVSLIIGTISDVLVPWLGGLLFNFETNLHVPLFQETFLILSTAIIGSILGIITKISKEPHFLHVFLSVFASLFYLTSFSQGLSYIEFVLMVLIVFIAVLIPCCMSDIFFPVILSKVKKKHHKKKKKKK
jgi:hypothetical protein